VALDSARHAWQVIWQLLLNNFKMYLAGKLSLLPRENTIWNLLTDVNLLFIEFWLKILKVATFNNLFETQLLSRYRRRFGFYGQPEMHK